ncbi:MAG: hypothetical protein LBJ71_03740 [Holosporaceae bacterium]|jgi:hypothetical protein|nr:hypothetical protein [Holosporaceae bacterium]
MRNLMLTLSVLTVCSVGAMDEGSFQKIIDDFKSDSYENAVSAAIKLIEEVPSSKFKHDTKYFLREFFHCMQSEEPKLKPFYDQVFKLYQSTNPEKLGYYSDRSSMMATFGDLAREKYEKTGNDWWLERFLFDDQYSEGVIEISDDDGALILEEEDEDEMEWKGLGISLGELIEIARKFSQNVSDQQNKD